MAQDRRTLLHLAREWLRERWSLLLGWALVPPSILGLKLHGPLSLTLGILGVVVSVVLLIVDSRTYRARRRDLFLEETDWPYGRAQVPLSQPGARLVRLRAEHVLFDPALDARLATTPIPLRVVPGEFALDQELRGYRACILHDRRGTVRFNGACVRLANDVNGELLDRPAAQRSADVQVVRYFDLLSSNYLASYAVRSRKTGRPLLCGIDLVLDRTTGSGR